MTNTSRKHYIKLAEAIRLTSQFSAMWPVHSSLATRIADIFAETDPRFDRKKFIDACNQVDTPFAPKLRERFVELEPDNFPPDNSSRLNTDE